MDKLINLLTSIKSGVDYSSQTALIDDGILDSFDIISIVAGISDTFDIQIPPEEIVPENFNSAAALDAMIARILEDE